MLSKEEIGAIVDDYDRMKLRIGMTASHSALDICDGAIEEGSFYESLLFMKSLSLSNIVIVENNNWSLATQIHERRSKIDLEKIYSERKYTYSLANYKIDCNNLSTDLITKKIITLYENN